MRYDPLGFNIRGYDLRPDTASLRFSAEVFLCNFLYRVDPFQRKHPLHTFEWEAVWNSSETRRMSPWV